MNEVLLRAAELIEKGWTHGTPARNAAGIPVHCTSEDATCWCAIGAMQRAAGDSYALFDQARSALLSIIDFKHVDTWNDHRDRTQAEVVEALRKAAAA